MLNTKFCLAKQLYCSASTHSTHFTRFSNLQQEQLCITSSCKVIAVFEKLSFISTTSTTNDTKSTASGVCYTVDTKSIAAK